MPRLRPFVLLPILALLAGCAAPRTATEGMPAEGVPAERSVRTHEGLLATLWTQTAVEYEAAALQAYRLAALQLDRALADPSWTAALEQQAQPDFDALPPAVVLDVDETVLDNSPYQARLILDDAVYSSATWDPWVREEQAAPVPGALAFTRYAAGRGVRVIYLTNRRSHLEEATRNNLARLGFPMAEGEDVVITRGEREEWADSDKGPRRAAVAERYRVLLLVGDNLGDFLDGVDASVAEREALAAPYADYWGTRWILLPNPQYGSWEGALFGFDYDLDAAGRQARRYEQLRPRRDP